MKKIISIVLVIMGSLILLHAKNIKPEKLKSRGVKEISVTQLHEMIEDKDFILVNVHIPYEGEIPQTDKFIPYNEIGEHLNELPDKNKKIVLYCRSDNMSTIAAETLTKAGYSNLYNLKGGMKAWKAAGYQLIERQRCNVSSLISGESFRAGGGILLVLFLSIPKTRSFLESTANIPNTSFIRQRLYNI